MGRSGCTPSTRDGRTHELTTTGGSFTRAAGTSSTPSSWRRRGRRRWTSGQAELRPSYLNGSVRDLVRSPESPSLRTMKTRDKLTLLQELLTRRTRRRKKRKKMNKSFKYQTE